MASRTIERITDVIQDLTDRLHTRGVDKLKARAEHHDWSDGFKQLRSKWQYIPGARSRRLSNKRLLELPEQKLVSFWQETVRRDTVGKGYFIRGWYHELYRHYFRGKKALDIGCGFGISSISFAAQGADFTFVDINEDNVELVRRVCVGLGIADRCEFMFLEELSDLDKLSRDYDVVCAFGSLHNAPASVMKPEYAKLCERLKNGGRWLQLAYPFARYRHDGAPGFEKWGELTDGPGTPWCEPLDVDTLLGYLAPTEFVCNLYYEWADSAFNWFDLTRRDR